MIENIISSENLYTSEEQTTDFPLNVEQSLNQIPIETKTDFDFFNAFFFNETESINSTANYTDVFENLQIPPSDWVNLTIVIIKGIIFGSIIVAAVLGNALVIISVHRNRKLR